MFCFTPHSNPSYLDQSNVEWWWSTFHFNYLWDVSTSVLTSDLISHTHKHLLYFQINCWFLGLNESSCFPNEPWTYDIISNPRKHILSQSLFCVSVSVRVRACKPPVRHVSAYRAVCQVYVHSAFLFGVGNVALLWHMCRSTHAHTRTHRCILNRNVLNAHQAVKTPWTPHELLKQELRTEAMTTFRMVKTLIIIYATKPWLFKGHQHSAHHHRNYC